MLQEIHRKLRNCLNKSGNFFELSGKSRDIFFWYGGGYSAFVFDWLFPLQKIKSDEVKFVRFFTITPTVFLVHGS